MQKTGELLDSLLLSEIDEVINTLPENLKGVTHDDISRKLVNAIQSEKDWTLTGQDIIDRAIEGKGKVFRVEILSCKRIFYFIKQFLQHF